MWKPLAFPTIWFYLRQPIDYASTCTPGTCLHSSKELSTSHLVCTSNSTSKMGIPTFPHHFNFASDTSLYIMADIFGNCQRLLVYKWALLCFILAISNQSLQVCTCNTSSNVCVPTLLTFRLHSKHISQMFPMSTFMIKQGKWHFKKIEKKHLNILKTSNGETF